MLPYYDMVHWIIYHANIETCTIFNDVGKVIGSLRPETLQKIQKSDIPKVCLNVDYIANFESKVLVKHKMEPTQCSKKWIVDARGFKIK